EGVVLAPKNPPPEGFAPFVSEVVASTPQSAKMVPAPSAGEPGSFASDGAMLHTGFIGRFVGTDLVDVLGRCDRLVHLEGRRASLLAVERAMSLHRRIRWAQAWIDHDQNGTCLLCLRYVATGET